MKLIYWEKKKNHDYLNLINIFFLKKERYYTKLKYSRVPQFDTASGGVASLFAALLGFLITEKFGWELIDSGDFYTVFMYIIFICLVVKIIIKLNEMDSNSFKLFSILNSFLYFWDLYSIILNFSIHITTTGVKYLK